MKIKKGQQIIFKIPEASNQTFKADVHLVGTAVDETNRTIKVHGHINDEENKFIMGMFVDADILSNAIKGKAMPKEAVSEIGGDYFVLVLKDKSDGNYIFDKVKLETGKQSEDYIEVLNFTDFKHNQVLLRGGFMLLTE